MYRDASRVMEQLLAQQERRGPARGESLQQKAQQASRKRGRKYGAPAKVGLKSLALASNVKNKSKTFAVVCETLKYRDALDEVMRGAHIEPDKLARSAGLLYVMLYDHLFGKGIKGGGAVKRAIRENDVALRKSLTKLMQEKGASTKEDLLPAHVRNVPKFPRYARVNEVFTTVEKVRAELDEASRASCTVDKHIPCLLRFPHGTDLHDHPLVLNGSMILQDKASCLPAEVIRLLCSQVAEDGKIPFDAIDATAAPGNKTSQLAAAGFRQVFAYDKSARRLALLEKRMEQAHADKIVKATCQDFLSVKADEEKLKDVRVILLDPSCSGSGMVGRVDHLLDAQNASDPSENDADESQEINQSRLEQLAKFQLECLNHALSFPQVECVSYSTCSVHSIENEAVVVAALEAHPEFTLARALPTWSTRGQTYKGLSADAAEQLVRADPSKDETSGFFVSLFVRKTSPLAAGVMDVGALERRKQKLRDRRKRRRKQSKPAAAEVSTGSP